MTLVVGADACRGGWVAIVLNDGRFADSLVAPTFAGLVERLPTTCSMPPSRLGPQSERRAAKRRRSLPIRQLRTAASSRSGTNRASSGCVRADLVTRLTPTIPTSRRRRQEARALAAHGVR